jgi:hypothetical protein
VNCARESTGVTSPSSWCHFSTAALLPAFANLVQGQNATRQTKLSISTNLMRRHLDTSQRAMIAATFATMSQGQPKKERKSANTSIDDAAELVNVSKDMVKDARTVLSGATPEIIAKVRSGEISVSKAAKEVRADAGSADRYRTANCRPWRGTRTWRTATRRPS